MILVMLGFALASQLMLGLGIILFSGVVFFQVVNLPVEFNASSRRRTNSWNWGSSISPSCRTSAKCSMPPR